MLVRRNRRDLGLEGSSGLPYRLLLAAMIGSPFRLHELEFHSFIAAFALEVATHPLILLDCPRTHQVGPSCVHLLSFWLLILIFVSQLVLFSYLGDLALPLQKVFVRKAAHI